MFENLRARLSARTDRLRSSTARSRPSGSGTADGSGRVPDGSVHFLYETVTRHRGADREEVAGLFADCWLHSSVAGMFALDVVGPGSVPDVPALLRRYPVDPGLLETARTRLVELSEERGHAPPGDGIVHELARALQVVVVSRITGEVFEHTRSALQRAADTSATPRVERDAWSALGRLYALGYHRLGGGGLFLDREVESLRRAVAPEQLGPFDPGPGPRDLDDLGTALYEQFKRTKQVRFAEESAHYHGLALERARGPRRASVLDNHGASLYVVARRNRDPDALRRSARSYRQAIATAGEDHAHKRTLRTKYLQVLRLVPEVCGSGSDLDQAIAEVRSVAGHCAHGEETITAVHSLAELLSFRFTMEQGLGDLDDAIEQLRTARSASGPGRPTWGNITNDLGAALAQRFDHTHEVEDLEESIGCFLEAEQHVPQELRVSVRHNIRKARKRLAEARLEPPRPNSGHGGQDETAIATAAFLGQNFQTTGNLSFLDRAIEGATEAVRSSPGFELHRVLAELWRERATLTGEPAALEKAFHHAHEAVSTASQEEASPGSRAACEETLGDLLRVRYEQYGDLDDLDSAISHLAHGARRDPAEGPSPTRNNRLGLALMRRYEHNRDLADLRMAIDTLSEAADSADEDEPVLPSLANNLASAYMARYARLGAPDDLDASIEQHRRAIRLGPRAPQRGTRLSNLAMALHHRYTIRHEQSDLREALSASQEALDTTRSHDHDRGRQLSTHANLLFERYRTTHDPADLELSLAQGESALAHGPASQAHRAEFLVAQAVRLLLGQAQDGTGRPEPDEGPDVGSAEFRAAFNGLHGNAATAAYERALELYDQARRLDSALMRDRARAARHWAQLASLRNLDEAISGAYFAFDLLSGMDWSGMRISDRLSVLREWSDFPPKAAAWAISSGRPLEAVRLLEQGRGQLWAQIADTRTNVAGSDPSVRRLSAQLETVHLELNRLAAPASAGPSRDDARDDARRGAALLRYNKERRRLISEIRRIKGFEDFLAPPTDEHLRAALCAGPVVLLNVGPGRCDALLLRDTAGALQVDVVPMRALRAGEVDRRVEAFEGALRTARGTRAELLTDRRAGVASRRSVKAGFLSATEEIQNLLAWGWEEITEPVLRVLGYESTPRDLLNWPRVWWCPTGPLTRFPLHATGYHDGSHRAVIDRVVSSDATTVRALADAYRRCRGPGPERLLCTGVPQLQDARERLVAVQDEVDGVADLAPLPVTRLDGSAATRSAILDHLTGHSWFHFAGHGTTHITDPSETALSAFDAPLTLVDIAMTLQGNAEIAFLSSCHGTSPSPAHPEDAVHLAAAFHTAGFRHSIAARHTVDDRAAQRLATGFYRQLRATGDPGLALHHAVREMRAELAEKRNQDELTDLHAWISHTHLGPASTGTEYVAQARESNRA